MMMVVATDAALPTTHGLRQILDVGELAAGRGGVEVRRKLVQLSRLGRIPLRLGGLGGGRQIRGDLLGNLRVLGRVRLLKLLERAHQLGEGRQRTAVRPL